ncbi:MAG: hypothetical protein IKP45_04730 [Bacteroidales bacterium]|nr:hypothetical protein [Bacteroidales bacterium]
MNFSFYIYGTPNDFDQYPIDNNDVNFLKLSGSDDIESRLTVLRRDNLVYYAYSRKLNEKSKKFIGFSLLFNGVYCKSPQKLFALFDDAYNDVLMKGEFLKFEKEKINFLVNKFYENPKEINRIKEFFSENIERNFKRDFVELPETFYVGKGIKNVSIRDSVETILSAISEYDCVNILNNEKTMSELEKTHLILSKVYTEKQELQGKYNKLLAQKKQYKAVLFLCLIVIGCAVTLFIFNKNLQGKDSQIKYLTEEKTKLNSEVDNLNQNVANLNQKNSNLTNQVTALSNRNEKLSKDLQDVTLQRDNLEKENSNIESRLNAKNRECNELYSNNNSLKRDKEKLERDNKSLKSDNDELKKNQPVWYKVTSNADYYYKYRCNSSYEETKCYITAGNYVKVYQETNGYGLTETGWLPMYKLTKYY